MYFLREIGKGDIKPQFPIDKGRVTGVTLNSEIFPGKCAPKREQTFLVIVKNYDSYFKYTRVYIL